MFDNSVILEFNDEQHSMFATLLKGFVSPYSPATSTYGFVASSFSYPSLTDPRSNVFFPDDVLRFRGCKLRKCAHPKEDGNDKHSLEYLDVPAGDDGDVAPGTLLYCAPEVKVRLPFTRVHEADGGSLTRQFHARPHKLKSDPHMSDAISPTVYSNTPNVCSQVIQQSSLPISKSWNQWMNQLIDSQVLVTAFCYTANPGCGRQLIHSSKVK